MKERQKITKSYLLLSVLAFIIIISIFIFVVPANAGVSPDVGRAIGDTANGTSAIIGETNLRFVSASGFPIPNGTIKSNWADSHIVIPFKEPFDSSRYEDKLVEGEYKVERVVGNTTFTTLIYFISPKLDVKTKVCGEEFSWVTKGDNMTFEADTNLWLITGTLLNNVTYKLIGPDGVQLHTVGNVSLSNIPVDYDGKNFTPPINTTGLKTDVYTLSIETDPDTNNGLDAEGSSVSFEVRSIGVTIEAEPKEQTVTKDIVFSIYTTPHANITLNVTWGMESKVWFRDDVGDIKKGKGGHNASGVSDKNGDFKAVAYSTDTGAYKITATEHGCSKENTTRSITTDSTWVKITPFEAEVSTDKDIYHIGEDVKITGSADAGDYVTIKVDGAVIGVELLTVDNKFSHIWKTEDKSPGSYKIAIWVTPPSDPETDLPDASVDIILLRGGLFAKPSADFVALDDDFVIEGTVPGRDRVDILTIAPKGGGGKGFDPDDILAETDGKLDAPGLTYSTCGVDTDGKFKTEKIKVSKKVDTGMYLIAVLNYGRDGEWGNSGNDSLLKVIGCPLCGKCRMEYLNLTIKTTDQILNITKYCTINAAGSDDLLDIATIKVEEGFVTLDPVEDVPLGSVFEVEGITNRKVGESIIVTVEGLGADAPKLKPKIADVKPDDKNFYNKFSVSFDTVTARIGKYIVTADDGDGHTDTTTVNILMAVEPAVTVSAAPTPVPVTAAEPEGISKGAGEGITPTPTSIPIPASKTGDELMEEFEEDVFHQALPGLIISSVWFIVMILLAVWVYRDAKAREKNGLLWLIIVILLGIIGLIIWFIVRPKEKKK